MTPWPVLPNGTDRCDWPAWAGDATCRRTALGGDAPSTMPGTRLEAIGDEGGNRK